MSDKKRMDSIVVRIRKSIWDEFSHYLGTEDGNKNAG